MTGNTSEGQGQGSEEGRAASLSGLHAEFKIWKYQVHKYSDPLLKLYVSSVNFNICCDFFTHYAPSGIKYCFSPKTEVISDYKITKIVPTF